jgi:hypothetical protein
MWGGGAGEVKQRRTGNMIQMIEHFPGKGEGKTEVVGKSIELASYGRQLRLFICIS